MKRVLKVILSIISTLVLAAIIIPLVLSIALSDSSIQTWAVKTTAKIISKNIGTEISIGHVDIQFFNRVVLGDVYVEDYQGDTLLFAKRIDVGVRGYNFTDQTLLLRSVNLAQADFFMTQDSTGMTNLQYVLDNIPKSTKPQSTVIFRMKVANYDFRDLHFKYRTFDAPDMPYGMNFKDLDIRKINLKGENFTLIGDSISTGIDAMSLIDKSGFKLERLSVAQATMNKQGFRLKHVKINDGASQLNMERFNMVADSMEEFSDFVNKVALDAVIKRSTVSTKTLAYFVPQMKKMPIACELKGKVNGTVANLKGNLTEISVMDTYMAIVFSIKGLPDITKTKFKVNIDKLSTDYDDVLKIVSDITGNPLKLPLQPQNMAKLENITFTGGFEGLITNFLAHGVLTTGLGGLDMNLQLSPNGKKLTNIQGTAGCNNFNIGALLGDALLGTLDLSARADGVMGRDSLKVDANVDVKNLLFNGYNYRDIILNGVMTDKAFDGLITSADSNLNFTFMGALDFSGKQPDFDFNLDIRTADLHKLGLNKRDSVSIIKGEIMAKFRGNNIDNLNGNIKMKGLEYFSGVDTIVLKDIDIHARNSENSKMVTMSSGFADIDFNGQYSYNDMFKYLKNTLLTYVPLLSRVEPGADAQIVPVEAEVISDAKLTENGYYTLNINIKESSKITNVLVPGLGISEGTQLKFKLNPYANSFELNVNSSLLQYNTMTAEDLRLVTKNQEDSLILTVNSSDLNISEISFPDFEVKAGAQNNMVDLVVSFYDSVKRSSMFLNTSTQFSQQDKLVQIASKVHESWFTSGDNAWYISSDTILMNNQGLSVDKFKMVSRDQEFLINGKMSSTTHDTLRLDITNFDIEPFSELLSKAGYYVKGRLNGNANIVGQKSDMLFYADLTVADAQVNDVPLLDSRLLTYWNAKENNLSINLSTEKYKDLISGSYHPKDKTYKADVNIPGVELSLLRPILKDVFSSMSGTADIHATLSGTGAAPKINGKADIKNFTGKVAFTNTGYTTSTTLNVVDNKLMITNALLTDGVGGTGNLDLMVDLNSFDNIRFDIKILVDKILALNTTLKDNPLFYGKAYATGGVNIKGEKGKVSMDIAASTAKESSFFLPLGGSQSVASTDFIVFRPMSEQRLGTEQQRDSLERKRLIARRKAASKNTSGASDLDINISMNVLPNTEAQLVIDPTLGDIIKARGNGRLDLRINPSKNIFTMSGDYTIEEGSYLFTLRNFVNKSFIIQPGGTIVWTGDPIDANLNITAIYKVKTSIAPLLGGGSSTGDDQSLNEQFKRRIPIDCSIHLTDKLSQPAIAFDVTAPDADAETQSILNNYLNTPELKTTQFVWLLVLQSFYSDNSTENGLKMGVGGTAATGLEMITNQISNWLSSDKYNFGFKYRPKDDTTEGEIEIGLSTEIISDRLMLEVEGNYGLGDNPNVANNQASTLTGDFYLTWVLDKSGKIRAKLFSRTVDRFEENKGLQESGIGIYYRDDFNNFGDLFKKKKVKKKAKKNE